MYSFIISTFKVKLEALDNDSIYYIHYSITAFAIIVSHDFGLPILSQCQNIVLLQLNNTYNVILYAVDKYYYT